ncbi:MAG: NADH dehydrogenase [Blautia sp.]|nr:NADH dehydrogenase [Blautia sp.]
MIALIVFLPFAAAIGSCLVGARSEEARDWFTVFFTFAELGLSFLVLVFAPSWDILYVFSDGLHFVTDGFRGVYCVVTAFMWALTTLFSREYFAHEREGLGRYLFFVLMTLGATEGVMLSADLMTAFVFFEILSFTSFTWVIHEENAAAIRAGYTYLFIAVIGGLVLFMGLLLLKNAAGTLFFVELAPSIEDAENTGMIFAACVCILFGFGCKAGMFPVHVWLPKAHPVAPSPGSALLSGILTKVGVYGILMTTLTSMMEERAFGLLVLCLGVITMALGAVLALFSVNLKRTLACSSMSQIGFILTGIGMAVILFEAGEWEGVVLAIAGTMLHMVNHSLIKLTLFMAAGVVVMNLHTLTLDDIRGWGRNKLFLKISFALGALGISGVPVFNGYISKTLLHEGIVEGIHAAEGLHVFLQAVEWIFLFSGGLTFAYMLKLFVVIFVEKHPSKQAEYDSKSGCMNSASTACIFGSSLLMLVLGNPFVMKQLAYKMMNYTGIPLEFIPSHEILHFKAFSLVNLKGSFISLAIGALVYFFFVQNVLVRENSYVNLWPAGLDLEELLYRPALTRWLPSAFGDFAAVYGENQILTPLCRYGLAGLGKAAELFGRNLLLIPLCRGIWWLGNLSGRLLETSLDLLVVGFRVILFRERPIRRSKDMQAKGMILWREEIKDAMTPITGNFSFALMMTCIGILVILIVIILSL